MRNEGALILEIVQPLPRDDGAAHPKAPTGICHSHEQRTRLLRMAHSERAPCLQLASRYDVGMLWIRPAPTEITVTDGDFMVFHERPPPRPQMPSVLTQNQRRPLNHPFPGVCLEDIICPGGIARENELRLTGPRQAPHLLQQMRITLEIGNGELSGNQLPDAGFKPGCIRCAELPFALLGIDPSFAWSNRTP